MHGLQRVTFRRSIIAAAYVEIKLTGVSSRSLAPSAILALAMRTRELQNQILKCYAHMHEKVVETYQWARCNFNTKPISYQTSTNKK